MTDEEVYALDAECDAMEREIKWLEDENAQLRELIKHLINPYLMGAVTGDGVSWHWCRKIYDGAVQRLQELGIEVDA